ncbi:hypothetical protein cypCar_00048190, partial [Cyprinus carpio]
MVKERKVFEEEGLEKYVAHQLELEDQPFTPGVSFPFVKALMNVNARLRELYPDSEELFDIVLMTNNHAQVGVRLINSINYYDLTIERFCMTGGESPIGYLKAYMTNLYLSKDSMKVQEAIEEGIAAATMFTCDSENELSDTQLRVAFDGDAVLFSDESEIIVKEHGLDTFFRHEKEFENKPLAQLLPTCVNVYAYKPAHELDVFDGHTRISSKAFLHYKHMDAGVDMLRGKTIIVTGANSGIGKATAAELLRRQGRVIMACRDRERAEKAALEIQQEAGPEQGELVIKLLDLASLKSVRIFCEDIIK